MEMKLYLLKFSAHSVLSVNLNQCGAKKVISLQNRKEEQVVSLFKSLALIQSNLIQLNWDSIISKPKKNNSSSLSISKDLFE